MTTRHIKADEVIFHEGDRSQEAFFIVSGTVEISIRTADGPRVLGRLGPGEIFGEMGLINDRPRTATARAVEPTIVEAIDENVFEEQILSRPDRLHAYLATLFDRLRTTDMLLQRELQRSRGGAGATMDTVILQRPTFARPAQTKVRLASCYEGTGWHGAPVRVEVTKFPFRIGRANAGASAALFARSDLAIADRIPHQISRHHCEIDIDGSGHVLRDRGSSLGTIVNGTTLGMNADSMEAQLHPGENHIVLGRGDSPHRFVVVIEG